MTAWSSSTRSTPPGIDLLGLLEQALREGHLIPVCFVSARSGAGVAKLLPNPTEANPPDFLQGEGAEARPMQARPGPSLHLLAQVFKVTTKCLLYVGDGRKPIQASHLYRLLGKN